MSVLIIAYAKNYKLWKKFVNSFQIEIRPTKNKYITYTTCDDNKLLVHCMYPQTELIQFIS